MVLGSAFYICNLLGIQQGLGVQLLLGSGHALLLWPHAGNACVKKVLGRVLMTPGLTFGHRELEKESTHGGLAPFWVDERLE